MDLSVGADIVSIKRIEKAYKNFGERFAKRVLTEREMAVFSKNKNKTQFLASRFAAKEAIYKAFNINPFSWKRIEVININGAPSVLIDGEKRDDFSISISHEKDYAVAFCIHKK